MFLLFVLMVFSFGRIFKYVSVIIRVALLPYICPYFLYIYHFFLVTAFQCVLMGINFNNNFCINLCHRECLQEKSLPIFAEFLSLGYLNQCVFYINIILLLNLIVNNIWLFFLQKCVKILIIFIFTFPHQYRI